MPQGFKETKKEKFELKITLFKFLKNDRTNFSVR